MIALRSVSIAFMCLLAGCQVSRPTTVSDESYACERLFSTQSIRVIPPATDQAATNVQPGIYDEWVTLTQPAEPVQITTETADESPAVSSTVTVLAAVMLPLAVESELTLAQLENMALASNPSLAEARALVSAARGKWFQVGLPPNTLVGYSGQQLGSGGAAEQHGLFIGQEFIRGGKLCLDRAVVALEVRKADHQRAVQQQRVLTDIRLAYYRVLVAELRDEKAGQLVKIAQKAVEQATALLELKEVSKADVMRARIELQKAQLMLKNAGNRYIGAWIRLIAVAGVPDLQPRPLAGDVEQTIQDIDPDDVMARLLSESPEMAVAVSEVDRARRVVARARAEPIPNVDLEAIIQSDNGTGSSNANLQVSIPIPWLNRNQGGIRQARAEVVAAERAVERLELAFKQRLATVYQRYANARNQVEDYSRQDGILAHSESTLEFVRDGYQNGDLNYLDLIAGQRMFSEVNLAYIEALGQLWAATVEIDGLLLKGSLDQ